MSDEKDGEVSREDYQSDIHGYIQFRLDREDLDPHTDPMEVANLIEEAASDYLVLTDSENIKDYEYHYITAVRISMMISAGNEMYHKHAEDLLSDFGEISITEETALSVAEKSGRYVIGDNVTLVYSMAYEFVNDMMGRLLPEILSDEVDDGTEDVLLSQIGSYPGRADLLAKAGIIDGETREGVRHIREVRRALVHDVEQRFTLSILDDLNKLDEVPGHLNTLYEKVYNEPAYRYIDE